MNGPTVDGVLVQWGERLFYPGNRRVVSSTPRLDTLTRRKAQVIRGRIEATVRRVPQVMVKVTGGGRGMQAIAAHFRYISKNGRLPIEDDRETVRTGRDGLHDLVDQWRLGGTRIGEQGHRREAFNVMLSMPAGTDPELLKRAAREFAQAELAGHRYVMVLHQHQANPHVHLSVKAEGLAGQRLNPRKADLHRWRETFAERLRGWGIEAEATRQATRGEQHRDQPLWRLRAADEGRVSASVKKMPPRSLPDPLSPGDWEEVATYPGRAAAMASWLNIGQALAESELSADRELARRVFAFVRGTPVYKDLRQLLDQRNKRRGTPEKDWDTSREMSRERSRERSRDASPTPARDRWAPADRNHDVPERTQDDRLRRDRDIER